MIKKVLYTLIFSSFLITVPFTINLWEFAFDSRTLMDVSYAFALQIGLIGSILLWWQYILGIRAIFGLFSRDLLAVLSVHKNMGIYGFLVILFHPLIIFLIYTANDISLINLKFDTKFDLFVKFGTLGFTFLTFIWLTSAILRTRLGFRSWKILHFLGYLILPLVLLHGINVGSTLQSTDLVYVWYFMLGTYLLFTIYRVLFQFRMNRYVYEIIDIHDEALDTKLMTLRSKSRKIKEPIPGQFAYVQIKGFFKENHPFTIADYNKETGDITFIIKKVGRWTNHLETFKVGTEFIVDGPYGIFLRDFKGYENLNFYAGGIGITPFIRTIKKALDENKNVTLFYSCRSEEFIAKREYLENLDIEYGDNFKIIYVISDSKEIEESKFTTIKGKLLDKDIITKHSSFPLLETFHAICGPPPFMKAVDKILLTEKIDQYNIDMEQFHY